MAVVYDGSLVGRLAEIVLLVAVVVVAVVAVSESAAVLLARPKAKPQGQGGRQSQRVEG